MKTWHLTAVLVAVVLTSPLGHSETLPAGAASYSSSNPIVCMKPTNCPPPGSSSQPVIPFGTGIPEFCQQNHLSPGTEATLVQCDNTAKNPGDLFCTPVVCPTERTCPDPLSCPSTCAAAGFATSVSGAAKMENSIINGKAAKPGAMPGCKECKGVPVCKYTDLANEQCCALAGTVMDLQDQIAHKKAEIDLRKKKKHEIQVALVELRRALKKLKVELEKVEDARATTFDCYNGSPTQSICIRPAGSQNGWGRFLVEVGAAALPCGKGALSVYDFVKEPGAKTVYKASCRAAKDLAGVDIIIDPFSQSNTVKNVTVYCSKKVGKTIMKSLVKQAPVVKKGGMLKCWVWNPLSVGIDVVATVFDPKNNDPVCLLGTWKQRQDVCNEAATAIAEYNTNIANIEAAITALEADLNFIESELQGLLVELAHLEKKLGLAEHERAACMNAAIEDEFKREEKNAVCGENKLCRSCGRDGSGPTECGYRVKKKQVVFCGNCPPGYSCAGGGGGPTEPVGGAPQSGGPGTCVKDGNLAHPEEYVRWLCESQGCPETVTAKDLETCIPTIVQCPADCQNPEN